jgi:hypothetical protein
MVAGAKDFQWEFFFSRKISQVFSSFRKKHQIEKALFFVQYKVLK